MNKHEFAFFWSQTLQHFSHHDDGSLVEISDKDLVHRITKIVRLQPGDQFILFDLPMHVQLTLQEVIDKKTIRCRLDKKVPPRVLKPIVRVILPLLKREALHEALYSAVELGATEVHLALTEKVHRKWSGDREFERLRSVMIAAAEQSKNFVIPALHPPVLLAEVLQKMENKEVYRLFLDPDGQPACTIFQNFAEQDNGIVLLLGPEGDLAEEEKKLIKQYDFVSVALTSTVLRAQQALVVGLGLIRSLMR